jgi:hypothetical protein
LRPQKARRSHMLTAVNEIAPMPNARTTKASGVLLVALVEELRVGTDVKGVGGLRAMVRHLFLQQALIRVANLAENPSQEQKARRPCHHHS